MNATNSRDSLLRFLKLRLDFDTYLDALACADEIALAELEKIGYMTTPVLLVNREVVVGYHLSKLHGLVRLQG